MSFRHTLMKNWYAVEAIPMYAIVGSVVVGAGWYLTRLARDPHVVWTKANPHPYLAVDQNTNTKLTSINHQFEKSWKRDKW